MKLILAMLTIVLLASCGAKISEKTEPPPLEQPKNAVELGRLVDGVYYDPQEYMAVKLPEGYGDKFEEQCSKNFSRYGMHSKAGEFAMVEVASKNYFGFDTNCEEGLLTLKRVQMSLIYPLIPGLRHIRDSFEELPDGKKIRFTAFTMPNSGTLYNAKLKVRSHAIKGLFFFNEQDKVVILTYQFNFFKDDNIPPSGDETARFLYKNLCDLYINVQINPITLTQPETL